MSAVRVAGDRRAADRRSKRGEVVLADAVRIYDAEVNNEPMFAETVNR